MLIAIHDMSADLRNPAPPRAAWLWSGGFLLFFLG
jgi:hypothetical protein